MDRILTVRTPGWTPYSGATGPTPSAPPAGGGIDLGLQNLTTPEAVAEELGVSFGANKAFLCRAVARASAAAANYCKRVFISQPLVEKIRAYPFIDSASLVQIPEFLYLSRRPIISLDAVLPSPLASVPLPPPGLAAVIEDGQPILPIWDPVAWEPPFPLGLYEADFAIGKLTRLRQNADYPINWYFREIQIAYTAGYTYPGGANPLPSDIEQAAIELTKELWFSRARDPLLMSSDVTGILAQRWWVGASGDGEYWPPRVVDYLSPYVETRF